MGEAQRSKCCNSKAIDREGTLTCIKCNKVLTAEDVYLVTTKSTVKAELKNKP